MHDDIVSHKQRGCYAPQGEMIIKMIKDKNFKKNISKEGTLLINEIDIIPLVAGNLVMRIAKEKEIPPSKLLNPARIVLGSYSDNWDTFDMNSSHFLDFQLLKIYSDTKALDLSVDLFSYYFDDSDEILPVMSCSHPHDWPYLFFAQLQRICQERGINPSEALFIFGIIFTGGQTDCWSNFDWMSFIHPIHVTVSLACHRNITN
tara:strand:- start:532 stop:1143 length:612 start_codon:yes stop_codon:yes gene_type:complete